jgi:c-di-GMP-binding flagellar brake protein YcgR
MPKKAIKERRKYPRIESRLALMVEHVARSVTDRPLTTESVNISGGGISCQIKQAVEPNTKVGMTILLPSFGRKGLKTQVVNCGGIVVRCEADSTRSEFELACMFTDIKREDKSLIQEYIGWRLMQDLVDERLSQP